MHVQQAELIAATHEDPLAEYTESSRRLEQFMKSHAGREDRDAWHDRSRCTRVRPRLGFEGIRKRGVSCCKQGEARYVVRYLVGRGGGSCGKAVEGG